ncbi:MAG: hypothetical protein RBR06_10325 [Desulfuromonadaceae bacterium]|nr:hypothetical protein [Desulfuromonadaceae bacterium]
MPERPTSHALEPAQAAMAVAPKGQRYAAHRLLGRAGQQLAESLGSVDAGAATH